MISVWMRRNRKIAEKVDADAAEESSEHGQATEG